MTQTLEATQLANEALFEKLASYDPVMVKAGADQVTEYTRWKVREGSFFEEIVPSLQVSNSQLTRLPHTPDPAIVIDFEPDVPAAVSVPFNVSPDTVYIRANRYTVTFHRIQTTMFAADVDHLRTWQMDIRQVVSDNAVKEMTTEKDRKFIRSVNTAIVGPGVTTITGGSVQWLQIPGGMDRDSLTEMLKVVPSTVSRIEAKVCLTNSQTIKDLIKLNRIEMGGDLAQETLRNGWTEETFLGKRWVATIKYELVPHGTVFLFGDPQYMGKHFFLEDTVMFVKREGPIIQFYAYQSVGAAIANTNAVGRVDFLGT